MCQKSCWLSLSVSQSVVANRTSSWLANHLRPNDVVVGGVDNSEGIFGRPKSQEPVASVSVGEFTVGGKSELGDGSQSAKIDQEFRLWCVGGDPADEHQG